MSAIRTLHIEAGMPTLDEARRQVIEEIKQAKRAGARVLKVIHGYIASTRGAHREYIEGTERAQPQRRWMAGWQHRLPQSRHITGC